MAAASDSGDALGSPLSRRTVSRHLSSPWSHIVRGSESEAFTVTTLSSPSVPIITPSESSAADSDRSPAKPSSTDGTVPEVQTESSDSSSNGNSNASARTKRPAWNKPSNGVIEVSPVMGASWPALSESARASPKSSSDSLKGLPDVSIPVTTSAAQGSVIASAPQKTNNNNNANPTSTQNHAFPVRQKSSKRGGGGTVNNGTHMPPTSQTTTQTAPAPASGPDSSPRDAPSHQKNSNSDNSQRVTTSGNDQPRGPFRRGNGGGPHPRGGGDGPFHGNYGSRRDQDRTNYEWNPHQNFSGRDIHVRQQRPGPRSFVRAPPPTPPPFISPPPVRPFPNPMGFPDLRSPLYYVPAPPPESIGGVVPYVAHAPPPGMFLSAPDPQLRAMLVKQIDYYFSSENLCKDIFLRQNMDEQGWVAISLIAGFNRVKQLTMYVPFIFDAVRSSTVVELQGDRIRKRNDWMNWLLPPPNLLGTTLPGSQSPNHDTLATRMEAIGLEETANHNSMSAPVEPRAEGVLSRSSSGEPSQLQGAIPTRVSNGQGMGQNTIQMGSDRSMFSRSVEKSGSC